MKVYFNGALKSVPKVTYRNELDRGSTREFVQVFYVQIFKFASFY